MIKETSGDFLQRLRGFYYVAEQGSITDATVMMGRVQPTITHQIKSLEKELGVDLFDRSSRKMELTPQGRILLEKAISLFEVIKDIKSEFEKKDVEYQGKIVIAASHAIVDAYLSQYIAKFRTAHPAVLFHLEGGIFETVFEKVESGEVDFGIAFYSDPVPKTMICHDLFEADVKLIAPKNNSFFPGKFPTLKQIAQAPLILFTRTGKIDPFIERPFAQKQLKPNVVITHNNFSSVKKYVAMGMGVAILGGYTVYEEDERSMDVYPLDRYYPKREYGLLLRKRKYLSPAVKGFIQTIKPDIHFTK